MGNARSAIINLIQSISFGTGPSTATEKSGHHSRHFTYGIACANPKALS